MLSEKWPAVCEHSATPLAGALQYYADRLGTAGAILSLLYYVLLGLGLVIAGQGQRLDILLLACSMLATLTPALAGGVQQAADQ